LRFTVERRDLRLRRAIRDCDSRPPTARLEARWAIGRGERSLAIDVFEYLGGVERGEINVALENLLRIVNALDTTLEELAHRAQV
jgi:hypothetical protein